MRALPRRVVVPVALLGAAATLVVAGVPWAHGTVPTVLSSDEITVDGTSAAPAVPALALVGLAAAAALAIGRRWAVVLASVVLLVAGASVAALSLGVVLQPEPAVLEAAGRVSGVRRLDGPAGATAAPFLAALLGVLVALAGLAGLVGRRDWGRTGRRFERTADPASGTGAPGREAAAPGPGAAVSERDRAMDDWDALGRGEDPSDPAGRR
ncbi:Trp biosynthesis-associated membrane protein [Georgenia sp. 10Sc9-8]|uniref:Trp biosynthesis-associated membrane protein n=1 Tax=Georgenia halotolerans TaxID=3028317 RepID=A0ABT5TTK0_9MICO|nr:Trp biosynthesis-associated membrane protein [Georgenia halotolerans]